ncbi:MAG: hypothetical protein N2C13_05460, partial [Chloroflexota bacterium]
SYADLPASAAEVEKIYIFVNKLDTRGIELWTGTSVPAGVAELIPNISPRPIFLISSGDGRQALVIQHFFELAGEPKEIWNIPDTQHGGSWVDYPQKFESRVIAFFAQALLGD